MRKYWPELTVSDVNAIVRSRLLDVKRDGQQAEVAVLLASAGDKNNSIVLLQVALDVHPVEIF